MASFWNKWLQHDDDGEPENYGEGPEYLPQHWLGADSEVLPRGLTRFSFWGGPADGETKVLPSEAVEYTEVLLQPRNDGQPYSWKPVFEHYGRDGDFMRYQGRSK